jgi:WS/DGAT/MGAT family acyltransferase
MDMNRPLWDMHVVEGLDQVEGLAPGSFAILTRLHHAIADGTTARGVLTALHHPAGKEPPPLAPLEPVVPPTLDSMAINAMLNNWQQIAQMPMRLAGLLPGAPALLGKASAGLLGTWITTEGKRTEQAINDVDVPDTPFNEEIGHRRVFQIRRYPLADIKRMRELAPGSTLNDVVLTLIGGAMARYIKASGSSEDADLVAACPINLREDKLTNESHLGNNISIMRVNLRSRTRDVAQRLAGVHAATVAAKLAQNATAARELIELSRSTPNLLMASSLPLLTAISLESKGPLRVSNCVITNVPGPQEPLYFMGARLELFTAIGPSAPGTGPFFAVSSYCGKLSISFTAGDAAVGDPQLLAECLDESFAELVEGARRARGETAGLPSATSAEAPIVAPQPAVKVRAKRASAKKGSSAPA